MRHKNPLTISYCQPVGQELKDLTVEAEKLIEAAKIKPPPSRAELDLVQENAPKLALKNTAESLAALALYPHMMLGDERGVAEFKDFKRCYAISPDTTLQILADLRKLAGERRRDESKREQKEAQMKSGRVRQFFMTHTMVAKRKGRFFLLENLSLDEPPKLGERKKGPPSLSLKKWASLEYRLKFIKKKQQEVTPEYVQNKLIKKQIHLVPVEELQAKDIAQLLTDDYLEKIENIQKQIAAVRKQIDNPKIPHDEKQIKAAKNYMQELGRLVAGMRRAGADVSPDDVRVERLKLAKQQKKN
jgi:hypothetical protein